MEPAVIHRKRSRAGRRPETANAFCGGAGRGVWIGNAMNKKRRGQLFFEGVGDCLLQCHGMTFFPGGRKGGVV